MKKVKIIRGENTQDLENELNSFLSRIDYGSHEVEIKEVNYGGCSVMVIMTEKGVNPLLEVMNGYREKSTESTNNQ